MIIPYSRPALPCPALPCPALPALPSARCKTLFSLQLSFDVVRYLDEKVLERLREDISTSSPLNKTGELTQCTPCVRRQVHSARASRCLCQSQLICSCTSCGQLRPATGRQQVPLFRPADVIAGWVVTPPQHPTLLRALRWPLTCTAPDRRADAIFKMDVSESRRRRRT